METTKQSQMFIKPDVMTDDYHNNLKFSNFVYFLCRLENAFLENFSSKIPEKRIFTSNEKSIY